MINGYEMQSFIFGIVAMSIAVIFMILLEKIKKWIYKKYLYTTKKYKS